MTDPRNWTEGDVAAHLQRFKPRWKRSEVEALKTYYQETPADVFSVSELAQRLSKTVKACIHMAGRLNLSDANRGPSLDLRKIRARRMTDWRRNHPNHKPALGCIPSKEVRAKISNGMARAWKDPTAPWNGDVYRQGLSDRFSKAPNLRRRYTKSNGGQRADLGDMYFRSAWEANYARYLNFLQKHQDIFRWEYEPDTFWFEDVKRGTRSYTPDFKIWPTEESLPHYEELKGWLDPRSKTKLKRMAKYYPETRVVLVGDIQYRAIAKSVKKLIPNWEGR